ncbi:hypothetical protein [Thorsellia kenyensis]|uniref:Uncharacterized protein n=1 Tax=Thorsellia kenyensis TaxID=1549888 RepID=A0ABV6CFA4_9GAMM
MYRNPHILKFNHHLLLSMKIVADSNLEECIIRFKLTREFATAIKNLSLLDWIQLLEQEDMIFISCDLDPKQVKRRLIHPDCSLFRLEQILGK